MLWQNTMDWGLQQQKLIFSQFWMLKQIKLPARLGSGEASSWLQTASCLFAVSSQGREGSKRREPSGSIRLGYHCVVSLNLNFLLELSWWLGGKEFTYQCRRHRRRRFNPWVGKIPWRRKWQPTLVFLPRESPWTEEPGRL